MITDLDRWFAAEILPHEGLLVRYLTKVWPNSADVLDLRQCIVADEVIRAHPYARQTDASDR